MNTAIIPLQQAIVLRGQRAWGRIKSTAAEQRQLWREVGEALNYGKAVSRKSADGEGFAAWREAHGFGDLPATTRQDAMWFAEKTTTVVENLPADITHPTRIRQAHRDSSAPESLVTPEPDAAITAAAVTVLKHQRRLAATDAHRKGTGPEAEIAERQFKKTAETLGVTPDALSRLVEKMDPVGKMLPAVRHGLLAYMEDVRLFAQSMKRLCKDSDGIVTPEYLLAFINAELTA